MNLKTMWFLVVSLVPLYRETTGQVDSLHRGFVIGYPCHEANLLGVEVTKHISSVPLFSDFLALLKHTLYNQYHVYIWRVSAQLSCGDICQIWMWFKESDSYICKIENFAYGEINERSFSNPHPRLLSFK